MALKFVMFALLITLAFVHGRNTPNASNSNEITKTQKERRSLIEIPVIGTLLLVAKLVISSALPLLEYKLAFLSSVSSLAYWIVQNYFPVIAGTAVVVGLCFITSFSSDPVYVVDDQLIQAARRLDQGSETYGRMM